jgi:hypothetical protein
VVQKKGVKAEPDSVALWLKPLAQAISAQAFPSARFVWLVGWSWDRGGGSWFKPNRRYPPVPASLQQQQLRGRITDWLVSAVCFLLF